MNKYMIYIGLLTVTAVLTVTISLIMLYPRISGISSLHSELDIHRRRLTIKEANLNNYVKNQEKLDKLRNEYITLDNIVPVYAKAAQSLHDVRNAMKYYAIAETNFYASGNIMSTGDQTERHMINLYLEGIGRFEDVVSFIDIINNGEIFYSVESVTLTMDGMNTRMEMNAVIVARRNYTEK